MARRHTLKGLREITDNGRTLVISVRQWLNLLRKQLVGGSSPLSGTNQISYVTIIFTLKSHVSLRPSV